MEKEAFLPTPTVRSSLPNVPFPWIVPSYPGSDHKNVWDPRVSQARVIIETQESVATDQREGQCETRADCITIAPGHSVTWPTGLWRIVCCLRLQWACSEKHRLGYLCTHCARKMSPAQKAAGGRVHTVHQIKISVMVFQAHRPLFPATM